MEKIISWLQIIRWRIMKRVFLFIMMFALLIFFLACRVSAPHFMKFNENTNFDISSVKPENGKAALVIARTTNYLGAAEFDTHLDKKLIGVTAWKCYFIKTDVDPGFHYVISRYENIEVAKINFEPGRIYYILQIPRRGYFVARISVKLLTPEDLLSTMDDDCKLLIYKTVRPENDLSDDDYQKIVNDYEEKIKNGQHKEHAGCRGAPAK